MALIDCEEGVAEVSDKAAGCVKCGAPLHSAIGLGARRRRCDDSNETFDEAAAKGRWGCKPGWEKRLAE